MQHSPNDIKEKLLRALDKDNNVVDMVSVIEAIAVLERIPITKDELEKTRLGKYINELRKKTKNESLAKRAKDLVRKWRKMILPQDSGAATLNGERASHGAANTSPCSIVASHLPGPGPGVGGCKSSSPAMANHHRHLSKGVAGLAAHAMSSPGYSQCSSTSTSPSLFAATMTGRLSNNKCDTPGALTSPYAARMAASSAGRFNTFKPVSPAPTTPAVGRTVSTPGAGSSSAKYPSAKSVSSPSIRNSPVVAARNAVIAGKKRPREEDGDHCDSSARRSISSVTIANSSSSPRLPPVPGPKMLINGDALADNSMDSLRSVESGEQEESIRESTSGAGAAGITADTNAKPRRKNSRRARVENCDMLKDKLASHLRVSKVKTTAELIQELKVRNSGSSTAVRTTGEHQLVQDAADYSVSRKAAYSALLGTDEDVTRNKTELMKKFLEDSVGSDAGATGSSSSKNHKLSHGGPSQGGRIGDESLNGVPGTSTFKSVDDTVAAILATLPPIRPEDYRWDSGSDDGDDVQSPVKAEAPDDETVTEEQLLRLHDGSWEGVNGNTDLNGGFKRWNESLAKTSFDSDVLHILPYVDIDD